MCMTKVILVILLAALLLWWCTGSNPKAAESYDYYEQQSKITGDTAVGNQVLGTYVAMFDAMQGPKMPQFELATCLWPHCTTDGAVSDFELQLEGERMRAEELNEPDVF